MPIRKNFLKSETKFTLIIIISIAFVTATHSQINRDQADDYAARKGWDEENKNRWLETSLGYNPHESLP